MKLLVLIKEIVHWNMHLFILITKISKVCKIKLTVPMLCQVNLVCNELKKKKLKIC